MTRICPTCGQEVNPAPLVTLLGHCKIQVESCDRKIDEAVKAKSERHERTARRAREKWNDWMKSLEEVIATQAEHK